VDLPGRHGASISEPIPSVEGWDGSIAYLDRDGVLNVGREDYVKTVDEVDMLQGAGDAVAALRAAGYRIVIVTNQSPINREVFTHEDLAEMNEAVINGLLEQNPSAEVDLILYSHYAPWEHSPVRKPAPGMLQVGRQLLSGLELEVTRDSSELSNRFDEGRSFMAGDRDADMGAAWHHGVRAFRVDAAEGIAGIIDRLLDDDDEGDHPEIRRSGPTP
jgi:histidinol-phosphate phosphatase family protein